MASISTTAARAPPATPAQISSPLAWQGHAEFVPTSRLGSISRSFAQSSSIGDLIDLLDPWSDAVKALVLSMGISNWHGRLGVATHVMSRLDGILVSWRCDMANVVQRHNFMHFFGTTRTLLAHAQILLPIGEALLQEVLIHHDDMTHEQVAAIIRFVEYSHIIDYLGRTGVLGRWCARSDSFFADYERVRPAARRSAARQQPLLTARARAFAEPVHIRLTVKEYRLYTKSMTGAIKRRRDPKIPETCAICMDSLKERKKWHELACGHRFHPHCLTTWLQKKCRLPQCPLCRFDVRETGVR